MFVFILFRPKSKSNRSNLAGDVAVPETFITDFSLKNTITNIEGQLDKDGTPCVDEDDDVMPSAAAEMGAGKIMNDLCNVPVILIFCCVIKYISSYNQ